MVSWNKRASSFQFPADLGREYRPKSVPPEADGLVADLDARFAQQIL
jgi:hypothetical protein